jgi:hypothetical protein
MLPRRQDLLERVLGDLARRKGHLAGLDEVNRVRWIRKGVDDLREIEDYQNNRNYRWRKERGKRGNDYGITRDI